MLPGELHRNHLLVEIAVPYNLAPRSGVGAAARQHHPVADRTRPAGTLAHRAGYCRLSGTSSRLDLMERRAGRTISRSYSPSVGGVM
jgi:hypothetical protein